MLTVAYGFSPSWLKYWEISCYSLFKNNPPPIKIYIFTDLLSKEDKERVNFLTNYFGEGYEIKHIFIENEVFVGEHLKRFTKYACYKMLVPECTPEDKILYLDCDTIINQPLNELYNLEMGENLIGGVVDTGVKGVEKRAIGLSITEPYFNSGVLLFNSKLIKKEFLTNNFITITNSLIKSDWVDQDAINIVTKNRKIIIDVIYNISRVTGSGLIKKEDIKIFHFAGTKNYNGENNWVKNMKHGNIWQEYKDEFNKIKGV